MKKFLLWSGITLLSLFVILLVGGYFYGRSRLPELPAMLQQALKSQGIDLAYKSVDVPKSGLSLTLRDLSISGTGLEYPVNAASATLSISLTLSNKPLVVGLNLDRPKIGHVASTTPPVKEKAASAPPAIAGLALSLVQFELGVTKADLPDFGVFGITASVRAKSLKLGAGGLEGVTLWHDVMVEKLAAADWLPGVHTEGRLTLDKKQVKMDKSILELGPFRLAIASRVDLATEEWSVAVSLPETEVSSASGAISSRASEWLSKISGKVGIDGEASGVGFDPKKNFKLGAANGSVVADNLKLTVKHPSAKGDIAIQAKGKFDVAKSKNFDFDAKVDLTGAEVQSADIFAKPKGTPLWVHAIGKGLDDQVSLSELALAFHNLKADGKGEVKAGESPEGSIQLTIKETSLQGWENFFPKYQDVKCQGTLAGSLDYKGPFKEWKRADVQANIKAANVTMPLLTDLVGAKEFHGEGFVSLNSDSTVSLQRGAIRALSSQTRLNLTSAQMSYGEFFEKAKGQPLEANFVVNSKGNRADISQGDIKLGAIKTQITGTIDKLEQPTANIRLAVSPFAAEEILRMSPYARKTIPGKLGGTLSAKGKVTGPLLDAKVSPRYEVDLSVKNIAFQFKQEGKKPVDIRNVTGTIALSPDHVSTKGLVFQSPGTSATLDLALVSFSSPDVKANLRADKFTLADFHEPEKKKEAVGFAMVPTAGKPVAPGEKVEDFRKNPLLKKARLNATAILKNADLGQLKSDLITAKVTYENLLLQVDPLNVHTFGGAVTTKTVWDGRKEVPVATVNLKADKVDANQFVGNWSDKARDLIFGRLNTDIQLSFSGLTPEEIKKSAKGGGGFTLNDGQIKTLRLTEKPVEALQKIPGLTSLKNNGVEEKLQQMVGSFKLQDGKINLSDLVMRSNLFDAQTTELGVDFDLNLSGKLVWFPKEGLIAGNLLEMIKDDAGRPSLPLTLGGALTSPSIAVDTSMIAGRIQQNAARKVSAEVKQKFQSEVEQKLKQGLQGLFK